MGEMEGSSQWRWMGEGWVRRRGKETRGKAEERERREPVLPKQ